MVQATNSRNKFIVMVSMVFCVGSSLEAMQAATKGQVQISLKQQQAFVAVCEAMDSRDLAKAKSLIDSSLTLLMCYDVKQRTLLHIALEKQWTEFALWLVSLEGCPINARDEKKKTPLHVATFMGETAVVTALIRKGAHFDSVDQPPPAKAAPGLGQQIWDGIRDKKNTVLHDTIEQGADDLEQLLLMEQYKRLIDTPNADGDTPLHRAVDCLDESSARKLVLAGATVAIANGGKRSPLHLATAAGSTPLCALLLSRLSTLTIPDVCCMLAKPPLSRDPYASEALLLLRDEKNYSQLTDGLVTITNNTTWRLVLTFVFDGKTGEFIIEPNDKFLLYAPLEKLTKLQVALYGKKWGYLQRTPLDVYTAWREKVAKEPTNAFEIEIKGEKGTIWQYISPFKVDNFGSGDVTDLHTSHVPADRLVASAFPCVASSIKRNKAVTARNFLQVSSGASEEAIQLAYSRLDELWKRECSASLADKPFIDRVRALLSLALQQLILQQPGLTFEFDSNERIAARDMQTYPALLKPALPCIIELFKEMKELTPEMIAFFLKKIRREELLRALRMRDSLGKTATYIALEKGNNQLFMFLHAKEAGENL